MTHKDIYTKFMIEYDKANVTSSYPSLTEYEVATVLDKAYNALIAQKVTGNNVRRTPLEADVKAISDLQPLIKTHNIDTEKITDTNVLKSSLPEDFLYYVQASMVWVNPNEEFIFSEASEPEDQTVTERISSISSTIYNRIIHEGYPENYTVFYAHEFDELPHPDVIYTDGTGGYFRFERRGAMAYDKITNRKMPVKLVTHEMAEKFIASSYNIPWIKIPVCYIEDDNVYTVYDSFKEPEIGDSKLSVTYIKTPHRFAKDLTRIQLLDENDLITSISYFEYKLSDNANENAYAIYDEFYNFECNATVAEELISLAVAFALENVESQRLNSKLNMRGLEA